MDRAKAMTETYRANREMILSPENQGQDILPGAFKIVASF
jgi:hypothetical protein